MKWPRSGIGYDVHRFADGRPLILGGIEIPHEKGLIGHSDADVLLHAIADALLGAAALGDIGVHFPPIDPKWKDLDSVEILKHSIELLAEHGWAPVNIDATVIAEAPRVNPHVPAMKQRIHQVAGLPLGSISIKATTNEGMGWIGQEEGIAVIATALIAPK